MLENFKEINRIMNHNFMQQPKPDKWHPTPQWVRNRSELARERATNRMVHIMKKMHSPMEFCPPNENLPGMQQS